MKHTAQHETNIWKGMAAGLIGGLAASYVMNQFQSGMEAMLTNGKQAELKPQFENQDDAEKDDATVKAAEAITESVAGHKLTKSEKKVAGPLMHYAMGATTGAVYGVAAEFQPLVASAAGLPFGAAVWLVADEVAVPALGLSGPPTDSPPSVHMKALASHVVYGVATDVMRRAIRRAL